jgi:surfactin family lipopeptide synthetase A
LDEQKIKTYLLRRLPDYMIPRTFVNLEKLSLTENGKLDIKSLPLMQLENKDNYLAPRSKQETLICKAFANILGVPKVGIDDDFFSFGGNSIQAIRLSSVLQANFDIKVADIFNLRTPRKLAKGTVYGKNILSRKLGMVRRVYKKKQFNNEYIDVKSRQKLDVYTKSFENLHVDISLIKSINNVLLTGSTGYLGCNILNQLLSMTNYKIYLLIRTDSQSEGIERINKKYQFYFGETLNDVMGSRVFVFKADIEENYLGLSQEEYQDLTIKIDSVIHAAALAKHYGEYNKFYSTNVRATINLLEFTRLTKLKDFHHISTAGVLSYISISDRKKYECTENDTPHISEVSNNVYVQTKLQGEHEVIRFRDLGLHCNIYRVGNLAFMSEGCQVQENVEDNVFYNWLKCLFTISCSTEVINKVEISQTDLTAQAIVKVFDKQSLSNQTYHVFNPHLFDMSTAFKNNGVEILSMEMFTDLIIRHVKMGSYYDLIVKFLLRQGWLDWYKEQNIIFVKILQNRTQHILKELDFEWPLITNEIICNYLGTLKLNRRIDNKDKK